MGRTLNLIALAATVYVLYKVAIRLTNRRTYLQQKHRLGCSEAQGRYPHKDPLFGIDLLFRDEKERADSVHLESIQQQFRDHGNTHELIFLGGRMIRTMDPQNMQAVLGINAQDYGLEPLREGLAEPLFGKGINTTDGEFWQYSRSLIKPTFTRADICNFTSLESHFKILLRLLPTNAAAVDLQPLFSKLFLDTSTEFLFGRSGGTLSDGPDKSGQVFADSFDYVMRGLGTRIRMGPLKFLYSDKKWFESVRNVHRFVERHIDEALEAERQRQQGIPVKTEVNRHYVLLHEMAKVTQDKLDLRSQIMAVFMPSRDTTAHLMSNVFWELSRRPEVYRQVRQSVLDVSGEPLTFEQLKSLKYLQWVINEAHRMYSISDNNPRNVLQDSVLPTGGGVSGKDKILVKKGDYISFNLYCLHHNPEYWGPDHNEFRPERWDGLRPFWNFIPFGGGPRTCPAQQLVNTEALYIISRMVQEFSAVKAADSEPWTEAWFIGPYSKLGCKVVLDA